MPKTISQLPAAASATLNAVVAADNATGTLTEKVTLGQIAALASGAVTSVAGKTGAVTLTVNDVTNAVGTSDSRLSDAREWSAGTISQAEAESGTSTTRQAFTALRVFQAIAAWWAGSAAKTKLDGIAANATANATDAQLRDRATHTGSQAIATVAGLQTALDAKAASSHVHSGSDITSGTIGAAYLPVPTGSTIGAVRAGTNITIDASGVISASGGGGSYTLPAATTSTLGGVKVGTGLAVTGDGTLSATGGGSYTLPQATTTTLGGVTVGTGLAVASGNISLASTAVTPGSYGAASSVATFTVASDGRLTAAGSTAIAISAGAVTGLATVATSGKYSDLSGRPTLGTAAAAATSDFAAASHKHSLADVTDSGATSGQVPQWNGSAWVPVTPGGGGYTLPPATTTTLGGVIVGTGLSVASGTVSLAASGVTAGTYRSVTVGTDGRVTGGTNPTTLAGYGITDAASSTHLHGNIANNGAIGTTSGLIVVTGASGVLTTTSAINLAGGTAAAPAITSTTGTSDTGLLFPAADSVAISTAGTQRLVVDSAGILGVGIANPTTLGGTTIHLHGPSGSRIRFTNTASGVAAGDGAEIAHDSLILYVWNRESGSIQFGTSGTERARLTETAFIVGSGDGTATTSTLTLRGPAKTGTDAVGDSLTIAGGNGTGTGGGGAIVFQTAAPGASGTTANTLATSLTIRAAGSVNFAPRAAPATGAAGDVYYDSTTNRLRLHNGTAYSDLPSVNVVASPTALAASANDYSLPAGDIVRLSSTAAVSITGLAATASGDTRVLLNVGSFAITLANQSASSVAANRLLVSFGSDFIIAPNASALVIYDATTARWRVL